MDLSAVERRLSERALLRRYGITSTTVRVTPNGDLEAVRETRWTDPPPTEADADIASLLTEVRRITTERDDARAEATKAKSDLADNDLILEERERQLRVSVLAYHTVVDAVIAYLSAADEYAYGDGEVTHTLAECRQVLDAVIGS